MYVGGLPVFVVKEASMCYEMMSSVAKISSVIGECMSMEHWWDDTDREKLKYLKENLSQCNFVHNKSHTDQTASTVKGQ
jgi:hypothetical protein